MVDKVSLRVLIIRRCASQALGINLREAHHSRAKRRVHAQLHHKRQGQAVIRAAKHHAAEVPQAGAHLAHVPRRAIRVEDRDRVPAGRGVVPVRPSS